MPTTPVLSVRGLRKAYGEVVALDGLDLDVAPGECVALIGHNGSGKTTAMRLAAGQLEPSAGRVTVAGVDLHHANDAHRARASLSFAPDNPVLYADLTVGEHLELVALAHGLGREAGDRAAELLDAFSLTGRRDFLPPQLSRGMRQKVQLACALVRPFDVLLLDEPVVGLDPPSQAALHGLLLGLRARRAGLLLTTHQLGFAAGLAHRAVVLSDGRVVDAGPYDRVVGGAEAVRLGLR
jgi:ABC-2 type transport system ATP-binding protein